MLAHGGVADLRHVGGRQHLLEHDFVHAQRRREHAGADVRHVQELQQALHGAVLAERAVQHREHGVRLEQPAAGRQRQRLSVVHPRAGALDRDRHDVVPRIRNRLAHERGGAQRYLVLGRPAAGQNGDSHGPTVAVGEGEGVAVPSRPTTIRTREPSGRFSSPSGDCSSTTPSSFASVTV